MTPIEPPPAALFGEALAGFEEARSREATAERDLSLAGLSVRLSFAGEALVPIVSAALAHLPRSSSTEPDLTVCIWQGRGTVAFPKVMPAAGGATNESVVRLAWGPTTRSFSLLDAGRNLALYCAGDIEDIPSHEAAAPLLAIFHWWLRDRARQVLHAGAVGTERGGVLLAGKGGVGKSTTALSCIGTRLRYAADDYCIATLGAEPAAHSLYSSGKVRAGHLGWFPHLRAVGHESVEEEKSILFLHPEHRADLITTFPLRAILLPSVGEQVQTTLRRASAAEVLKALAPSTIFQLPAADTRDLSFLAELARRVPGYVLELGRDLSLVEPAIVAVLEE